MKAKLKKYCAFGSLTSYGDVIVLDGVFYSGTFFVIVFVWELVCLPLVGSGNKKFTGGKMR